MADRQVFETIALPHLHLLRNYARMLTSNTEDAKDLVQETYYKAFRFWHRFEEGTNIKGWLCRIMKNAFINQYRKNTRCPVRVEYDESRCSHSLAQVSPVGPRLQKEFSVDELFGDEVSRSINSISSPFRTVVILSDVWEHTYAEIANLVECPIGTVRSRLHRGRRELQRKLLGFAAANGYVPRKSESVRQL